MRLAVYYALHTLKNIIRKLCKTWVAVFLLICVAFGAVVGIGAAVLTDTLEDEPTYTEEEVVEEDEFQIPPLSEVLPVVELAVAGLALIMIFWNVLSADKNGGQIFQMADVNLLFPSPMKPQSVLLFRLLGQIGTLLLVSLYMLFQLPNLVLNAGISTLSALALVLVWFLLLAYSKLINVLLYTVASTHDRIKPRIRPVAYGVVGVLIAGFLLFWKSGSLPLYDALKAFFNVGWTRAIPVIGWLKGLAVYAIEGNWPAAGGCLAALLIGMVALVWIIWHIKADFYEDAMQRSAETAEIMQAAQDSASGVMVRRKKDRSDRLKRDGLTRGRGASVYFFKTMYNRFRFAHGRVFTKTSETYLVTAVGACAVMAFGFETYSLIPTALILAVFCFFRSLGNPLATDINQTSFRMVPESAHAKVLFSLLGGSVNCALDLVPAFLVATVWMRADPLTALAWLLFAVTVDFYSANVGLFLDLSIPTSAGKMIKQLIQVLFVYMGLAPVIVLIVLGFVFELLPLFLAIAALFTCGVGMIFFAISPLFLQHGQK